MLEYLDVMHLTESNIFSDAKTFMTIIHMINAKGFFFIF